MRFEDVADLLPGIVDGSADPEPTAAAFIRTDLRCQAELARYRRLLRSLERLRDWQVEPPPGALAATLAALGGEPAPVGRARRLALAGATAGAVLAGAATAVVISRMRRRVVGLAG